MENIEVNFSIERTELNANEYIDFCKHLFLSLQKFDDVFKTIKTLNLRSKKKVEYKNDLSDFNWENLKPIIEEDEITYINSDKNDTKLKNNSMSWAGFSATFIFGNSDCYISVSQGANEERPSWINFKFSDSFHSKLTKEYVISLIKLISTYTNVKFVNTIYGDYFLKVWQRGKHSIGWINFTKEKAFAKHLAKEDICEQLENGIIFSISETLPSCTDDALVNKSIELSNLLSQYSHP